MRLCDTKGEIRAAYSSLLEVVPTHVITRWTILSKLVKLYTYMYMCCRVQYIVYATNISLTEHVQYVLVVLYGSHLQLHM